MTDTRYKLILQTHLWRTSDEVFALVHRSRWGETHFDELETELSPLEFIPGMPVMDVSAATPTKAAVFARLQAGWYGDYHPTPRRQFVFTIAGEAEVAVSDGEKRRMTRGAVWLTEDTKGKGHLTRVTDAGDWLIALVWLAELVCQRRLETEDAAAFRLLSRVSERTIRSCWKRVPAETEGCV